MAEEMFKTTLMGGFDKDDVLAKVQKMKDEAYAEKTKLIKAGKDKDKKIEELKRQLEQKDVEREQMLNEQQTQHENELNELQAQHENKLNELQAQYENKLSELQAQHKKELNEQQIQHENAQSDLRLRLRIKEEQKDKLEREISEKYQRYIDRYDLIGNLVLQSQERAEEIITDAEQKRDMLMEEARVEAQKCLDAVQSEVDEKLAEGKRKYIAVQEEMNEIVELINQAQKRFMASYREVHQIISSMPESMRELEDEVEEEQNKKLANEEMISETAVQEEGIRGEEENQDSLDEEDEYDMIEENLVHILREYEGEDEE